MPVTAFFDITGMQQGRLYLFEDNRLEDARPFEIGEDHRFYAGELPEVEEAFVSLPLDALDYRVLELPFSEPERVREVLPFELDGLILGGTESAAIDAVVLGEAEGGKHRVLAAYVQKDALARLIEGLSALGVDPRAITCLELANAVRAAEGGEDMGRALLEPPALEESERPALALKEAENPTINLRRGEFAYTRDAERARRSFRFTAGLLIAILLIVSGDIAVKAAKVRKETARVSEDIISTYKGAFPAEKPGTAQGLAYKMKARLKEMREKDRALKAVSPLGFLMKLQETSPEGLAYTDITLDREFVVLKGEAQSLSGVEQAKSSLEGFLAEVKISETGQSVKDKVAFTITAKAEAP